ncbi:hypothetical protein R9X47_09675 [Wukongibacter baidiensis]|uniref:hypothetical protein n=1 Tax=Wukongibacter baidiensis TaxID=1723361 RepID=UPI003D7FAB24
MLIKLLEKHPIIASKEAKRLGMVRGAIIQDNRLVAILSSVEGEYEPHLSTYRNYINRYIEIPIENLIIGPDAFMIEKSTGANIHFSHSQIVYSGMSLYTRTGEFVGQVTGIEMDTDYTIKGIHIDGSYIGAKKIIKIGNVIIVDLKIMEEHVDTASENSEVFLTVAHEEKGIRDEIAVGETDKESNEEEVSNIESEDTAIPYEEYKEETYDTETDLIYSRYRYLLGKKLINQIVVANKTYEKDSIIDTNLIEEAINRNCILSVIMNTED